MRTLETINAELKEAEATYKENSFKINDLTRELRQNQAKTSSAIDKLRAEQRAYRSIRKGTTKPEMHIVLRWKNGVKADTRAKKGTYRTIINNVLKYGLPNSYDVWG